MPAKFKVGLCAYGMSGKLFQAPFFAVHPGFSLGYIVRRSNPASITEYPDTQILRSTEALIAKPDIDLIVVNTPVQTHYEIAKQALATGKHVLVEKPFTVTYRQALELIDIAREHNAKLSVFQNRRFDRDYLRVKTILESGNLGQIHEATIRFDRYRTGSSGKLHKEGNFPGSGALYDLGSHLIDQALQLFGPPENIYADLMQLRPDVESDDYFELLLYYQQLRVRLISNVMVTRPEPGYVLNGALGSLSQLRSDMQEKELGAGICPTSENWQKPLSEPDSILTYHEQNNIKRKESFSDPGNYFWFFDALHQFLNGRGPNPVSPEQAAEVIRIIEIAKESSTAGKKISCK
ncbi:MAG TPA: Gfo/Idh/MocA family oxidoreductase [Saprospiraceae bacterium]|nr:Gfo/Idh/MocA family oxidoreductase [Saprospiraceae bacterium]